MTVVNKSKIRPDVLAAYDKVGAESAKVTKAYLRKKFYLLPKVMALTKKVGTLNDQVYREKINDTERLRKMLFLKEILFMTKFSRGMEEVQADWAQKAYPYSPDLRFEKIQIGNVPAEWQIPKNAHASRVMLFYHSGGFCLGSINTERFVSAEVGKRLGLKVLSVEYRRAPEHPFPAALDDCYAAYRWLLDQGVKAKDIVLVGGSAGGSLVLSAITKMKQDKIPLPAGACCVSPCTDHSLNDTRLFQNGETDLVLGNGFVFSLLLAYVRDHDPRDPLVSPFWGDLAGFPPLLLQVSTTEILYFDNVNFAEKARDAGVPLTFHAFPGMPHGLGMMFMKLNPGWPELDEALSELDKFIQTIF
nr:alpha/beta hydrolase [Candidatus Sigynarchaeota archaeon]